MVAKNFKSGYTKVNVNCPSFEKGEGQVILWFRSEKPISQLNSDWGGNRLIMVRTCNSQENILRSLPPQDAS